jgi:hypothetical protein
LFPHCGKDGFAGKYHALQVDGQDVIPDRFLDVRWAGVSASDAYIVMQDVDSSVCGETVLDEFGTA